LSLSKKKHRVKPANRNAEGIGRVGSATKTVNDGLKNKEVGFQWQVEIDATRKSLDVGVNVGGGTLRRTDYGDTIGGQEEKDWRILGRAEGYLKRSQESTHYHS